MNLYEGGQADARQSDAAAPPPSLFRKRYKKLTDYEIALHDAIKDKADELARLIQLVPQHTGDGVAPPADPLERLAVNRGGNVTLALRHLEDAVYRAVKALTT
jgi:hypothetical protein